MLSFLQPDETTVVSFAVTAEIDQHRVVSKHLRVILTLDIPADRALRPVALYILPDALEAWLRESVDLAEQEEIPLQKLLAAQSWERAYLSLKAFLGDALPVSSVRVADAAIRAAAVIAMGHFTKAAQQEGGDFTMKALCEAVVTRINSRVGQSTKAGWRGGSLPLEEKAPCTCWRPWKPTIVCNSQAPAQVDNGDKAAPSGSTLSFIGESHVRYLSSP